MVSPPSTPHPQRKCLSCVNKVSVLHHTWHFACRPKHFLVYVLYTVCGKIMYCIVFFPLYIYAQLWAGHTPRKHTDVYGCNVTKCDLIHQRLSGTTPQPELASWKYLYCNLRTWSLIWTIPLYNEKPSASFNCHVTRLGSGWSQQESPVFKLISRRHLHSSGPLQDLQVLPSTSSVWSELMCSCPV